MKTIDLAFLLQVAGFLHLGLILANLSMPRSFNLRFHIAPLPTFIRRMFWVYYSVLNLCLIGFGLITFTQAQTLSAGGGLARAVCVFLAAFWTLRLLAGIFVFKMQPYLTTISRRLGYGAINVVIVYLLTVYKWAALKGGN